MLVYFSIIIISLLGFCGLVIDTGRMELRQNQLQAAADAGALAGAGELWHGGTGSNYQTAATNDVAAYETANNIASTGTPATQIGASYGPYVGDYSTVQVIVTQSFPTIFLGLLGHASASITLTARAVAQIPPCMIFLGNPTLGGTYDYYLSSAGSTTVTSYACPEYFKDGLVIDGFSNIRNSQVRVSGSASASYGSNTTWPIVYNVPPISDPLSYITAPTASVCTNSAPVSNLNQSSSAIISFTPGTYCGKNQLYSPGPINCNLTAIAVTPALDIEGNYASLVGFGACPNQSLTNGGNCTSTPTVSFAPGLYVFVGGVNFTCVTVIGTGVTMYFTNSSSVGFGQVRMTSSTWNVSAPTSAANGGIPGISVMSDRNWSGSTPISTQDFLLTYSTWSADGVLYLTGTGLDGYALRFSAPNYLNVVAANMNDYDADTNPATNYASLPGGNPLHTAVALVQ